MSQDSSTLASSQGDTGNTTINVFSPEGVVPLEIPLELACSLILLKGQAVDTYTVHDIMTASSTLKKFRDLQETSPTSPRLMATPSQDIVQMSLDSRGAITVQELLSSASLEGRIQMVGQLSRAVLPLSQHAHGCRVIQKVLEIGTLEERLALAAALPLSRIVDCCVDVNANHVMQKFVEVLPSNFVDFIIEAVSSPFTISRLSVHCYGCRVVQRILARCLPAQTEKVLEGIVSSVGEMVSDQFGNYVVQHALDFGRENDKLRIIRTLISRDLVLLSCNKFASNVVEKAARMGDASTGVLVDALVAMSQDQTLEIMRDRFGNYVIRAFLELPLTRYPQLAAVRELVRANSSTLKKFTYGWHLVEKLQKGGDKENKDSRAALAHMLQGWAANEGWQSP